MKKTNRSLILILLSILFFSGARMNNSVRKFSKKDCKIELSALYENKKVVLQMKLTNMSSDTIKVPLFFFPSDDEEFFGNWFRIKDAKGKNIEYHGIQADIEYDPESGVIFKPNQSYSEIITTLTNYYELLENETYSIQYAGQLGESNIVNLTIK